MKKPVLLCPDAGSALAETPKTTARTGKRTRSASRIIAIFRLTCSLLFEVWVRRRLSHHDGSFLLLGAAFGPPAFVLLGAAFGPPAFVLLGAALGPPAFVLPGTAQGSAYLDDIDAVMGVRVVVVDDSLVCRSTLREILEVDRDIRVVGEAGDGSQALRVIMQERPHLVTMDLKMPGTSGFEAIEEIMAKMPIPILVVTGHSRKSSAAAFEAIRRGALQLAEKPMLGSGSSARELRAQVRLLARVPVVRHVAGSRDKPLRHPTAAAVVPLPRDTVQTSAGRAPLLVGVAASAGGPGAIAALLAQIGTPFPGCIAVVQHLPKGFAGSFVEFLQSRTHLRVSLVQDSAAREAGTVLVAPDDRHLVLVDRYRLRAIDRPPVDGFRPSATVLFRSMADILGSDAAGVILSGMGNDGADGLERMRRNGALTIAQDEATAAVYGMPRAASERGAAELVLPLGQIAAALTRSRSARKQESHP